MLYLIFQNNSSWQQYTWHNFEIAKPFKTFLKFVIAECWNHSSQSSECSRHLKIFISNDVFQLWEQLEIRGSQIGRIKWGANLNNSFLAKNYFIPLCWLRKGSLGLAVHFICRIWPPQISRCSQSWKTSWKINIFKRRRRHSECDVCFKQHSNGL